MTLYWILRSLRIALFVWSPTCTHNRSDSVAALYVNRALYAHTQNIRLHGCTIFQKALSTHTQHIRLRCCASCHMKRSKCDMKRSNDVKRSNGVECVAGLHVGMCCWASCASFLHVSVSALQVVGLEESYVHTPHTEDSNDALFSKSPMCTHTTDPTPLLCLMSRGSCVHTATRQSLSAQRVHTTREIPVVFFAKEPSKRDDILQKRPLLDTWDSNDALSAYGVATIRRLLNIIRLFCRISSLL